MLVSMVFQTLYVLVDQYWVGRLGTDAVAAVALSGNLMFIVLAATQMLGVGTTTLVALATRQLYAESLSANAATLRLAAEYLLWFIPALALQFGLIAMGSALRGT